MKVREKERGTSTERRNNPTNKQHSRQRRLGTSSLATLILVYHDCCYSLFPRLSLTLPLTEEFSTCIAVRLTINLESEDESALSLSSLSLLPSFPFSFNYPGNSVSSSLTLSPTLTRSKSRVSQFSLSLYLSSFFLSRTDNVYSVKRQGKKKRRQYDRFTRHLSLSSVFPF